MPTLSPAGEDMMMRGHNDFNGQRLKGKRTPLITQPMNENTGAAHIRANLRD